MPRPNCYIEDCDRIHHAQGLCSIHYGRQRKSAIKRGDWEPVEVDAAPFKERIKQFLELGYSYTMLEALTGIERHTFARALLRDRQHVLEDNIEKLNRVPLTPLWKMWRRDLGCDYKVPSYLAGRRVRALMAKGYTTTRLAEASGLTSQTIRRLAYGKTSEFIMRSNLLRVVEVYERLWDQEPPMPHHHSELTRYAKWPLPMEWDDDELDRPGVEEEVQARALDRARTHRRNAYMRNYQRRKRNQKASAKV